MPPGPPPWSDVMFKHCRPALPLAWILGSPLLFLGLICAEAPAQSPGPCPLSCLACMEPNCTSAPVRSGYCPQQHGTGGGSGGYDLPMGRASASGGGDQRKSGGYSLTTQDDFVVSGLAPGTPLSFRAWLAIEGSVSYMCGRVDATLIEGSGNTSSKAFFSDASDRSGTAIQDSLSVLIIRSSGESFRLEIRLSAGGCPDGRGNLASALRFSGLPVGATVQSCQGLFSDRSTREILGPFQGGLSIASAP